jgi:methionine synthase II (cobalamin-independent)
MDKSGLKGLATGIGSLPHKDAGLALDLIFKYTPQIPFWPQLPKRDIRESMIAQFSEGLPCIKVTDKGISFDAANKEKELEKFYEKIINKDTDYFKISPDFAKGLHAFKQKLGKANLRLIKEIKCQVVGPFTFAASLNDEEGRALLHDSEMMQAITEGLILKALWQIRFLEEFGKSIIVFIDEPYLGCFGSAYTPINREDVVKVLTEFTKRIMGSGTVGTGVHCCGNTDWSIFTDIKSIDIISFDAFGFLDKLVLYADDLKRFFASDRILCWGIVPTQEFNDDITSEKLINKIDEGIDTLAKKGVDKEELCKKLLLSPACGLGTLDVEKSERIFKTLSEISEKFKK